MHTIDNADLFIPDVSEIERLLLSNPVTIPNEDVIYESWQRVQKNISFLKVLEET